jgi:hypothetical protein
LRVILSRQPLHPNKAKLNYAWSLIASLTLTMHPRGRGYHSKPRGLIGQCPTSPFAQPILNLSMTHRACMDNHCLANDKIDLGGITLPSEMKPTQPPLAQTTSPLPDPQRQKLPKLTALTRALWLGSLFT